MVASMHLYSLRLRDAPQSPIGTPLPIPLFHLQTLLLRSSEMTDHQVLKRNPRKDLATKLTDTVRLFPIHRQQGR